VGQPDSVTGVVIVVLLVLPGAAFTWALERQMGAYGVSLADRVLRFVGVSFVFHLVLLPLDFWVLQRVLRAAGDAPKWGEVLLGWVYLAVLFTAAYVIGSVIGGLYRSRGGSNGEWRRLRSRLSADAERTLLRWALGHDPAPRAWDRLFTDRTSRYLRIRLVDGTWVAGLFADRSYAGGFPNPTDLLLERAWAVDQATGQLAEDPGPSYPLYVPAEQIAWVEQIPIAIDDSKEGAT